MVYIVIVTKRGLGGAEKRFIGLWLHLQRTGRADVRLILSEEIWAMLAELREFAGISSYADRVETFAPSDAELRRLLFRLWRANRQSVFHYIHAPPFLLQRFPSRRNVFSMTAATWKYHNARGLVASYVGMLMAGRIDVLNEPVWAGLRRTFFWRRSEITLTPNSFVDLDVYRPAPFAERKSRLAFVGTFTRDKGIFRLVELLPELDRLLREEGIAADYRLLGSDIEHPGIVEACRALRSRVDVEAYREENPADVLSTAKVFLSLQQTTNYPSKSLLEALACGSLPIVTDVPDSRRIAPEAFSFYVPKEFSARDLAKQAVRILRMPEAEFTAKVNAARAHLKQSFSIETMARYYLEVYARAGR